MHRPKSRKILLTSVRLLSCPSCADTAREKGWRGRLGREVGAIVPRGTGTGKQTHAQRGAEAGNDLGGGDHRAVQPMPLLKGRYCYPVPPMSERHISCTMASKITVSGILELKITSAVCMVSNCCNGCCRNVPILALSIQQFSPHHLFLHRVHQATSRIHERMAGEKCSISEQRTWIRSRAAAPHWQDSCHRQCVAHSQGGPSGPSG